jgi:hypothetical protein
MQSLAPSAATAMTEGLYPKETLLGLGPELVSPAVVALTPADAPTRKIMLAGAGCFEQANITMTRGLMGMQYLVLRRGPMTSGAPPFLSVKSCLTL